LTIFNSPGYVTFRDFELYSSDANRVSSQMGVGFNPTDMYAADHIRRVLQTFPGVFSGIGEFTIHKEFVSSKIAGETADLQNRALDRLLDFSAEVGLVVIIHNDMDVPFPKQGAPPAYLDQMKALLKRHPGTTIIWAHTGLGRIVRPIKDHAANLAVILSDPAFKNVYFDMSWAERMLRQERQHQRLMLTVVPRFRLVSELRRQMRHAFGPITLRPIQPE